MKKATKKATRYGLVKKYTSKKYKDQKPTPEELQDAYGYLDYCNDCGEKLTAFEPYIHGTLGNCHMFGCKSYQRILGVMLNFPVKIIKTVLAFLLIPFMIIYLGTKEFLKELRC